MTTTRQRILEIIEAVEPLGACAQIADEIDAKDAEIAKLHAELKEYRVAVLIAELSDLSEQYWAATWQAGFEYAVGVAVFDPSADRRVWGGRQLLEVEVERLRGLADRLGGWIHEFDDGLNFIPISEWKALSFRDAGKVGA